MGVRWIFDNLKRQSLCQSAEALRGVAALAAIESHQLARSWHLLPGRSNQNGLQLRRIWELVRVGYPFFVYIHFFGENLKFAFSVYVVAGKAVTTVM